MNAREYYDNGRHSLSRHEPLQNEIFSSDETYFVNYIFKPTKIVKVNRQRTTDNGFFSVRS